MEQAYSTDTEGGRPVQLRFSITGRMHVPSYLEFVAERAGWLGVSGWAAADAEAVTVVAAGPEAMVGALEMACLLGPLSAIISGISGSDEPGPIAAGFSVRDQK